MVLCRREIMQEIYQILKNTIRERLLDSVLAAGSLGGQGVKLRESSERQSGDEDRDTDFTAGHRSPFKKTGENGHHDRPPPSQKDGRGPPRPRIGNTNLNISNPRSQRKRFVVDDRVGHK
jgi:hypothetical protein